MAREWIKTLRIEKFTSQTSLAEAAGLKPARYSRIENGYCDILADEAAAIAKVLEVNPQFIATGVRQPETPAASAPTPHISPPIIDSVPTLSHMPNGLAKAKSAPCTVSVDRVGSGATLAPEKLKRSGEAVSLSIKPSSLPPTASPSPELVKVQTVSASEVIVNTDLNDPQRFNRFRLPLVED